MITRLSAIFVLIVPLFANAAVKTETIEYKDGDASLTGYLMYDDAV